MSVKAKVQGVLANWSPFAGPARTLHAHDGEVEVTCQMVALERLGVAFESFYVEHARLAHADLARLEQVSQNLAAKLTYLLEAVATIETDSEEWVVLLRSQPPHKDADCTRYYEVRVAKGGKLSLVRYESHKGTPGRTVIPCEVTREVFFRLIEDFAAAA